MPLDINSTRVLILAPSGRGKTNIAKRVVGPLLKYYGKTYNRKAVIIDGKGADWQEIVKPNTKATNLLNNEIPFAIKNAKIYVPRYDIKLNKKFISFSFGPDVFSFKDWSQFAALDGVPAWTLKKIMHKNRDAFLTAEGLLMEINNLPTNRNEMEYRDMSFFADYRTKNKLVKQIEILSEDKVLLEDEDFDVVSDLEQGKIPVFLFSKDETPGYARFYVGKIIDLIFKAREKEYIEKKNKLGRVDFIIEEAPVFFNKYMKTEDNPCARAIAGILRRGRTFGMSIYLITQNIYDMHQAILENLDYMIIGPGISPADHEMLRRMQLPEYILEEVKRLVFRPKQNIREFILIYPDRMRYIIFNPAECQIGAARE